MSTVRFYIALIALVLASCSNEVVYDVGTLEPSNEGNKTELKDDLQFMSIAYRDLFGRRYLGCVKYNAQSIHILR